MDPASADFRSILFPRGDPELRVEAPACFRDLNLDQVVAAVVARRDEYGLATYFHTPLSSIDEVAYRQGVFRDLETEPLRKAVRAFAEAMRKVRAYLALSGKQPHRLEKQRWLLDAALTYCAAVTTLRGSLVELDTRSRGLRSVGRYLRSYIASDRFSRLAEDAQRVVAGLDGVRYTLRIKGGRVTVAVYADEDDFTAEVERTFARFRQSAVESHLVNVPDSGSMGHVEAQIAERVARLFPAEFRALDGFCTRHADFLDPLVTRFDREVQFYLAYLEHVERLGDLPLAYPSLVEEWDETLVEDGWDIALAGATRSSTSAPIVRNGFALEGTERVLVVTGPNQGGKTTFARVVGQLHYVASLGVPVPAARATLILTDGLFTVFGRREDIATLRGRLDEELVRLKAILEQATEHSLILLNEVFASTSVSDAVFLGREILDRITSLGCAAVWVTFVDEVASFGEQTVSMVAGVEPEDPTRRTFAITRRPADGRAYAWAIAQKYGISYEELRRRVGR
jgi:DNA mismatch repair protein MutS